MNQPVKTRQQIAEEYSISVRTLSRWIKDKNLSIGKGLLTPTDQKAIYQAFGHPSHK